MTDKIRRTIVLFLAHIILVSACIIALPSAAYGWTNKITDPSGTRGYNYTDSPALAEKLDSVFGGDVGLYSSSSCERSSGVSAPLGCTDLNGGRQYYVWSEDSGFPISGYQCFIYANAVYNYLFSDVPDNSYCARPDSMCVASNTVISSGDQLRALFTESAVRTGAYVRTTVNSDGSYSGDGHSMIVLSYDDRYIDILDGNSDGNGLVCVKTYTWNELQSAHFARRRLGKIVQPTDSCYDGLYPVPAPAAAAEDEDAEAKDAEAGTSGDTSGEYGFWMYGAAGEPDDPPFCCPLSGPSAGERSREIHQKLSELAFGPAENADERICALELLRELPPIQTSDSDVSC